MKELGVDAREIDIKPMAQQMLADLDHPFAKGKKVYDITFENVQAGLRTDYLFRLANKEGGLVVGTGDLSELALGWCTYGVGDHMSHYNVNASVAKTLIQHLIRWSAASGHYSEGAAKVHARHPRHEDLARARAARRRRRDPVDRRRDRSLQPPRLLPQPDDPLRAPRPRASPSSPTPPGATAKAGEWPASITAKDRVAYDLPDHRQMAGGLRQALLRDQPVQALRRPQRSQDHLRRLALPARRLAHAERFSPARPGWKISPGSRPSWASRR